jgi:hypothetical protein
MPKMRLVCLPSLLGVGVASVFAAVDAPGGACVCGSGASGKAEAELEVPNVEGFEEAMTRDGATMQAHTKIAAFKQHCLGICALRFRSSLFGCKDCCLSDENKGHFVSDAALSQAA